MAKTPGEKSKVKTGKAGVIPRLPVNKLLSIDALIPVKAKTFDVQKVNEIAEMIWLLKSLSEPCGKPSAYLSAGFAAHSANIVRRSAKCHVACLMKNG
jgi:hypothetical protein